MKSIKSNNEHKKIFKRGKRYASAVGQIFVLPAEEYEVGIVVSRKIGNAVKRNRAKRRIKEAMRKQNIQAQIIIKVNEAVDNLSFKDIIGGIENSIERIKIGQINNH
ncbi:MAG: ribonuclease P protein component [Candidatus Margulisiibacteriota bacterium]